MAVLSFDEIVAQLSAEERKVFDNVLSNHKELKEGYLRQDDYSRKSAELAADKEKHAADLEHAQKMKVWSELSVPVWDHLAEVGIVDKETGEEKWSAQKEQYEKDLAAARAQALGDGMKPEELDARVKQLIKESGLSLTKEEITNLYASEGKKMAQEVFDANWKTREADFNSKTIPFVAGFSSAVSVVANHWEKESGKTWGPDQSTALFEMMSKEQNFDPFKVEEKFLAPIKADKQREVDIEAEVEKRLKAKRALPGGGDEFYIPQPEDQKGALERALAASGTQGDFEAGIKARAVAAAKELQSEGKG